MTSEDADLSQLTEREQELQAKRAAGQADADDIEELWNIRVLLRQKEWAENNV